MSKISLASPLNQDSMLDKKIKIGKCKRLNKDNVNILFHGFSCCNNEIAELFSSEYDIEKYGFRMVEGPENADILVFSGAYVGKEQKDYLNTIYSKMSQPKYSISVGSCANGGGIYQNKIDGIFKEDDVQIIEADMYIPGCPPSAEAILYGLLKLKEQY